LLGQSWRDQRLFQGGGEREDADAFHLRSFEVLVQQINAFPQAGFEQIELLHEMQIA
jgi:hypothetical protein